jgi:short-subunit dehydrogenase
MYAGMSDAQGTALVTGASAGIGKAFAHQLARRGYDVVLTARRRDRLEELAHAIEQQWSVRAHVLPDDLADPAAPRRLFDRIAERGATVDVLVNNAGYGVPGTFAQTEWKAQADFIQVLVTAVAHLTHLFLPGMLERDRGHVINVASLAGLLPGAPGNTLYGAAKAFCIKLSESLSLELVGTNVHATAVCPGFTFSEFHDVTGVRDRVSKMPAFMWMDADRVAREGVEAALRGEVVWVSGPINRLIASLAKVLPGAAAREVMLRRARDFRQLD